MFFTIVGIHGKYIEVRIGTTGIIDENVVQVHNFNYICK